MFYRSATTILFYLGLAVILAGSAAEKAQAKLNPVFDKLLLFNSPATLPTVDVTAEGKDWTGINFQSLFVRANYYASLKKGKILSIKASLPHIWGAPDQSRTPDGGKRRWGEFDFTITNADEIRSRAVPACNNLKKDGARTDSSHTAYMVLPFSLTVRAERVGNKSEKTASGNVQVRLNCLKAPRSTEISHLAVEIDDSSDRCPKNGEVVVGFNTNRGDPITFEIRHQNTDLLVSQHTAQPYMIDGQYVATKRIDILVDSQTKFVEVRIKDSSEFSRWRPRPRPITCPTFKVTSVWLNYDVSNKIDCPKTVKETVTFGANGPGHASFQIKTQGGLVVHSGIVTFKLDGTQYVATAKRHNLTMGEFDSDMMALVHLHPGANSGWVRLAVECMKVLAGTLELRAFKASACKGEAAFSVRSNIAGKVPVSIACTGNRSWERRVQASKTGPNTYIGVAVLPFDLAKNEHVNCALKTRSPLPVKVLALRGKTFQCIKGAVAPGSGHLTPTASPPQSSSASPADKTSATCKTEWKKVCERRPVRTCRNHVKTQCKRTPKRKCKAVVTRQCRPVRRRVCRRVGSTNRRSCRTIVRRKCERKVKRTCRRVWEKTCKRVSEKKCRIAFETSCHRKRTVICNR